MNKDIRKSLSLPRILDANLDRAREGLRIIEEWCRFGLENNRLAEECKQMRQEVARWHSHEIRIARDTLNDPGTILSHPQEETRRSIEHLLQSNLCRIQEALRVLEEYGKLYQVEMGIAFKKIRYQVYILESNLLTHNRYQKLKKSPLYLVTSKSKNLLSVVESALKEGVTLVQYRDKNTDDIFRLKTAKDICQLCHDYNSLFIMNDRVDLALAVNADGVHLGQQDIPISLARQILGPNRIVGRSTTNPQEMDQAITQGADYIGVGPVYATPTKPGKIPAGLDYVDYARKHSPIPWFAIGGIDQENINEVIIAGAKQVAIVRAIMEADNPAAVTQELLKKLSISMI
ncbi:MAG: thiamine phosphate synthase [cyanobacterium endosymbiont of Rhopalodia musculus]|uniref:thiamine phosphate synthase n=1 Tax=cyanobacterium endosymbiont of Epithemia clementina EcSB TaxID=3034674 RepID=UPI00247FB242|nr:thiamine phosphate synthase [cyanobacterium endosymbiont of Epithemia clementina EcSB]WGT68185.1 thiamine phosphate synthase [cyanobacterium endosymbiont of Epithemia clementina EcSB]